MATNFTTFIKSKSKSGSVKFDKRTMRQQMSIQDSTKLRMYEEIKELQMISSNISISEKETESVIEKVSLYPNFTIINTKLLAVCFGIMKNMNPYSDEEFGKKVLEYQNDIYKAFDISEDIRKMKIKEDIVVYGQYINFMNSNIEDNDDESEYEEDESEYESD